MSDQNQVTVVKDINTVLISDTGAQGPQGLQGTTGAQGVQGVQGVQGTTGTQGVIGSQGVQGAIGLQGTTGTQGATGTQGTIGATGSQGIQGNQGTTGSQGATGTQGLTGSQGLQGAQGVQGRTGAQGITGIQGATGTQGIVGSQGAIGLQGTTGTQGATGTQGFAGVQGTAGATGSQGATGIQGSFGTQGTTGAGTQGTIGNQGVGGIQGTQGVTGASGTSSSIFEYNARTNSQTPPPNSGDIKWNNAVQILATNIYVSHLTTANVDIDVLLANIKNGDIFFIQDKNDSANYQEWQVNGTPSSVFNDYWTYPATLLTSSGTGTTGFTNGHNISLITQSVGVQGTTGAQGAIGAQGTFGSQGALGLQGVQGTNGLNGSQGIQGVIGLQGTNGIQGTGGTQGLIGAQGAEGAQGTFGSQGITGAQGAIGAQGQAGSQGLAGSQGTTGLQGAQGAIGAQGQTGLNGIQGAQGTNGIQGTVGAQGTIGSTGLQGSTGVQGTQGIQGLGYAQAQGTQGTQGATGSTYTAPTLGSTLISSGATVGTVSNLTLNNATLASPNFQNGVKAKIGITTNGSPLKGFVYYDGVTAGTDAIAAGNYFVGMQKSGNVWIACTLYSGSTFYAYSSTDGINWSSLGYVNTGPYNNLSNSKVAYNGTCFILVGGRGSVYKTTNITDFAAIANPPTFNVGGYYAGNATITSFNGYFLLPDYSGSSMFYSTDGDNWNTATLPTTAQWTSTVYGAGKYVVVANDSQTAAYATTPSGTWTSITMPDTGYQSLIYDGTKFIAMGSSKLATSTDGVTWTAQTFTESGYWNMAYSSGSYVATNINSYLNYILTSTDGITWAQYAMPDNVYGYHNIGLVTTQPASGTLSITGNSGTSGQSLVSTGTGIEWGAPAGATPTVAGTVYGQVNSLNTGIGKNVFDTSILNTQSNIGIGNQTLNYLTTGSGNIVISSGYAAITTGFDNTGVGAGVFSNTTTSDYNTAVGSGALSGSQAGDSNTAVGYYALVQAGTEATQNASFGYRAGLYADRVANSTFIGANAGNIPGYFDFYTNQNITVIGANATPSSKTVNNQITLGDNQISTIRAQVTSITSLSDERDKTAIEPLAVGLDFVNELKPVQFEWNMRDGGKVGQLDAGFIAQDLVAAEDATGLADYLQLTMRENPEKLEATQGRLIPILVKAIQELSAEVKALKEGK